jgi:hypothetical protein
MLQAIIKTSGRQFEQEITFQGLLNSGCVEFVDQDSINDSLSYFVVVIGLRFDIRQERARRARLYRDRRRTAAVFQSDPCSIPMLVRWRDRIESHPSLKSDADSIHVHFESMGGVTTPIRSEMSIDGQQYYGTAV